MRMVDVRTEFGASEAPFPVGGSCFGETAAAGTIAAADAPVDPFAMVGQSPRFRQALDLIAVAAKSDVTVLLLGETGSGKELAARAIHYGGERAARAFVAVNCGSLPDTLCEEEFFGHERGAFTDARSCRSGLLVQAHGGTLYLDEVDALRPHGQVVLLRVLEGRSFRPLGSTREQCADVRWVAATHTRLDRLVETGAFRADLYYRLCAFPLHLPPLRERDGDIPSLAAYFLAKHRPLGRQLSLAPDALAALGTHDWPGNVRELENAIRRGILMAQGDCIARADLLLPGAIGTSDRHFNAVKREVMARFERDFLCRVMAEHGWNVTRAARAIGKDRRELGRLLKKHGLLPPVPLALPSHPPNGVGSPMETATDGSSLSGLGDHPDIPGPPPVAVAS